MNLISGARYLIDTNILVYSVDRTSPFYQAVTDMFQKAAEDGVEFVIAQQNLTEYIAVLTQGYKVSQASAAEDAKAFAAQFEVIAPLPTTLNTFFNLMEQSNSSTYVFDLYLAATMLDNEVRRILTANQKDFQNIGLDEVVGIK